MQLQQLPTTAAKAERNTVLITHANPEDNVVARWLAVRLSMLGYKVWVDLQSLQYGGDFWQDIEHALRHQAIKQIVLVSEHLRKPGVMKELALGDIIGKQLRDPAFMIPVRISDIPFGDLPTELLRRDVLDASSNWAAMLRPLDKTLHEAGVRKVANPNGQLLADMVASQELGRQIVRQKPEDLLSNWFEVDHARCSVWIHQGRGTSAQLQAWSNATRVPHVLLGNQVVTLSTPDGLHETDYAPAPLKTIASLPLPSVLSGKYDTLGSRADTRRVVVNLLRQHWDFTMRRSNLAPATYASGQRGWFFPDGLVDGNVKLRLSNGLRVNRLLSGKFKDRRWHLCLVAQPKLWPTPLFRVHANVVVTTDGQSPLPGEQLQRLRLRLTRSWWNDKWRDLLLAGMGWLSRAGPEISLAAGAEQLAVKSHPMTATFPLSFSAEEQRASEVADDGSIELFEEYDTGSDVELDPEQEGDAVEPVR